MIKAIVNLRKEVIDYFDMFGIRYDEIDGSRYYNNNQWLKVDANGVVTVENFQDLPDSVKLVHLKYINQPPKESNEELLDDIKEVRRFFKKGSPLTEMLDKIIEKHDSNHNIKK